MKINETNDALFLFVYNTVIKKKDPEIARYSYTYPKTPKYQEFSKYCQNFIYYD